jgi:hypothetical protein
MGSYVVYVHHNKINGKRAHTHGLKWAYAENTEVL